MKCLQEAEFEELHIRWHGGRRGKAYKASSERRCVRRWDENIAAMLKATNTQAETYLGIRHTTRAHMFTREAGWLSTFMNQLQSPHSSQRCSGASMESES